MICQQVWLGGASGVLASLAGSGLIPKEYKSLTSGSTYEFVGGGIALVESTNFSILNLGDAVNVRSNIFKDFSRGYAYGYGYGYATAGSNQIKRLNGGRNGSYFLAAPYAAETATWNSYNRDVMATSLEVEYVSGTTGSDKESSKTQDIVKYDFYTIPFEKKIKIQSNVNNTYIMIYANEE